MKNIISAALLLITATGCSTQLNKVTYPEFASVAAETINIESDTTPIYIGGYGSSMVYHPADSCFYLLSDRGPNVDGLTSESKVFPIPDYVPAIGQFRLVGDSLILVKRITLKESDGRNFSGLPNAAGSGITGEVAYNLCGEIIVNPTRGLDTEGLALAPDGTFWISDEYAPFVIQFDRNGVLMRELSPSKGLPAYFEKRRTNRGMEGLTISKDGKKLYGIMQSPLFMPDNSTKDISVNNRILEIELTSGQTREFIYTMESPENVVSEICFVNDSIMLVLERDGKFPQKNTGFKRVYQINITHATDISDKEIEMLSTAEMESQNVVPAAKVLFVDILAAIPNYRHDKPEGITLIGDSVLCIANDDDFGINATADGRYASKLDTKGRLDKNIIYFIPVWCRNSLKR